MERISNRDQFNSDSKGYSKDPSEEELNYYRSEVDYLRKELEHITKKNTQALIELKHQQEQQLSKLFSEKETNLQQEFASILSLQKVLSHESDECSRLRQLILNTKLEHSERINESNAELQRLVKDADYLRKEAIQNCKEEILQYQKKIEQSRMQQGKVLRETEESRHGELYEIEKGLENESNKIKQLEYEAQGLRQKVIEKTSYTEGELEKIHATLRSTQRIAEQQEGDLKFLREERERARKESRENEKELVMAKNRISNLKIENEELKAQMKRLERLTYGA